MADRPGRPKEDDTKTSDASPTPAGQEDAAKPAAAPKAANEGDATNPQTDRAAADTEEKPEPTGAGKPTTPADADTDKPATAPSPAEPAEPAEQPDADEATTDWEARATAAEKELADLKLKVAAQNAAAEAGLPPEAAQFLRGDNDEEIKAAAETLASLIAPSSPLDRNPSPRGQEPDDRPDLATIGARLFRN